MIIQFGLNIEDRCYPSSIQNPEKVDRFFGVQGFLSWLEKQLGIRMPDRHDYLRIEQYRQALALYSKIDTGAFYIPSFQSDAIGTAKAMLERRDELLLAAWDFESKEETPARLKVLAGIERLIKTAEDIELYDGFAERFNRVMQLLPMLALPLQKVYLNEPLRLLPIYLQALFEQLRSLMVELVEIPTAHYLSDQISDLEYFKRRLLKLECPVQPLQKDGSIVVLKSKRETYAAEYLTRLFSSNPAYRPLCLIADKNRALDNCLIENGMPSLGIMSASIARPTLQILKLVSTFLWKPVNPYKILEFVSLPNTPIHPFLARSVARVMAEKPGLFSNDWNRMVRQFFEYYETKITEQPDNKEQYEDERTEAQQQYSFWFNRKRYDSAKSAPKKEIITLFQYVFRWASKTLDKNIKNIEFYQQQIENPATTHTDSERYAQKIANLINKQPAIESLRQQTDNLLQVLKALPTSDTFLSPLRLDRMVRTINEPAAIRFRAEEAGHLPFVHHSSAILRPIPSVLWWNFVDSERKASFSKWYPLERQYFSHLGLQLDSPSAENSSLLWQRIQPFIKTQKRIVLVVPESIDGKEQIAHPLWGDLCAVFGESAMDAITVDLERQSNIEFLNQYYQLPGYVSLQSVDLARPKAFIQLEKLDHLNYQTASYTSLDALLYYPYQWLFNYQTKFRKSAILSVTRDRRLMGNLAHSLFQNLFTTVKQSSESWNKTTLLNWIDANVPSLFEKEGAVLLMYGMEPERVGFVNKIKQAAWALLSAIQNNGWSIADTELRVEGNMAGQAIKGFVDLVLERGSEKLIVDLKWGGYNYRKEQLKNNTDLQLVIYSKLLADSSGWAHTAYFIIEKACLLARNNQAFKEAEALNDAQDFREVHQHIWTTIIKTYHWRMRQIQNGLIEVRTQDTFDELEALVEAEEETLELLEMKREGAKFDDFKVLINRIK